MTAIYFFVTAAVIIRSGPLASPVFACGISAISAPAARRDPDDVHVSACAAASGVDAIVTGDNDLSALKSFKDIPILDGGKAAEITTQIAGCDFGLPFMGVCAIIDSRTGIDEICHNSLSGKSKKRSSG